MSRAYTHKHATYMQTTVTHTHTKRRSKWAGFCATTTPTTTTTQGRWRFKTSNRSQLFGSLARRSTYIHTYRRIYTLAYICTHAFVWREGCEKHQRASSKYMRSATRRGVPRTRRPLDSMCVCAMRRCAMPRWARWRGSCGAVFVLLCRPVICLYTSDIVASNGDAFNHTLYVSYVRIALHRTIDGSIELDAFNSKECTLCSAQTIPTMYIPYTTGDTCTNICTLYIENPPAQHKRGACTGWINVCSLCVFALGMPYLSGHHTTAAYTVYTFIHKSTFAVRLYLMFVLCTPTRQQRSQKSM